MESCCEPPWAAVTEAGAVASLDTPRPKKASVWLELFFLRVPSQSFSPSPEKPQGNQHFHGLCGPVFCFLLFLFLRRTSRKLHALKQTRDDTRSGYFTLYVRDLSPFFWSTSQLVKHAFSFFFFFLWLMGCGKSACPFQGHFFILSLDLSLSFSPRKRPFGAFWRALI